MIAYYFLPIILFLGIITSYEDVKFGKIRNKWIVFALVFSFFIYLLLFINRQIEGKDIFLTLINFAVAVIFSFALWNFKFWSAGDAKLFIAFCTLIPANLYSFPFVEFFPAFNLFVNVIVLFFVYLVIKNILSISKTVAKKTFASNLKKFPEVLVAIFALSWAAKLMGGWFNFKSVFYSFVIYAAVYMVANALITKTISYFKIKKLKAIHIYLFIIALRFIFDLQGILDFNLIFSIIISAVLYSFLLRTISDILAENSVKNISVSKLKKGDIIYNKKGKNGFNALQPEGLTSAEARKIKAFCRKRKIKKIPVAETTAFAPAMFAGVILTLVFENIANLIYLFVYFFNMLRGLF